MILSFQGADAFIWIRNSKSLPDLHTAVLESVLLILGSIASFGTRLKSEHPQDISLDSTFGSEEET